MRTSRPLTRFARSRPRFTRSTPPSQLFQPLTLRQHIANRLDGERALSRMLSVVGLLALTLAAIGLYGVIAYTVERRTREIGVRVALGAQPRDVLRLFVGDAARLALIGVAAGLVPAIGVTALLAGSLVGVTVADPIAIGGVMAVLTTVALVRRLSSGPPRRAGRPADRAAKGIRRAPRPERGAGGKPDEAGRRARASGGAHEH